jgi:hypothetical protein
VSRWRAAGAPDCVSGLHEAAFTANEQQKQLIERIEAMIPSWPMGPMVRAMSRADGKAIPDRYPLVGRNIASRQELVDEIEALTRSEFRASVNAERRATLAIGALILHWGQFDSSLGWLMKEMRARHIKIGLGGFPDEHPGDQMGQLSLLRKFIGACSDNPSDLREFDRLRERISRATSIRDDLVHGALAIGNTTGTDEGLYMFCMPARKPKKTSRGFVEARHEMVSHPLSEIFQAVDDLWDDLHALEVLVRRIGE